MVRTTPDLIPQRPPRNTIELGGKNAQGDYYIFAWSSRTPWKATYDMLLGLDC